MTNMTGSNLQQIRGALSLLPCEECVIRREYFIDGSCKHRIAVDGSQDEEAVRRLIRDMRSVGTLPKEVRKGR